MFALRADTDSALVLRALVLVLRAPLETRALARLGLAKHLVAEVANILASFLYGIKRVYSTTDAEGTRTHGRR